MFERTLFRVSVCFGCLLATACLTVEPIGLSAQMTGVSPDEQAEIDWVNPATLVKQIELLKEVPQAVGWATETLLIFEAMADGEISPAQYKRSLARIWEKRNQLNEVSKAVWGNRRLSQSEMSERMRVTGELARIGYRIDRRMAVWQRLQSTWEEPKTGPQFTSASFRQISFDQLEKGWVEYLQLKEFKKAFGAITPDAALQRKVSRDILARIYSPVLKQSQRDFIQEAIDPEIVRFLKSHASQPVDRVKLLNRLERYELTPNPVAGFHLNNDYQNLIWSDDIYKQSVADEIDRHYRNANFRLSVSDRLLNRLIPKLPITQMPVSETVKGALVSGNSQVSNRLQVSFEPNPNEIALRLETEGYVQSDTIARTKTFRVANQGQARFQVYQRIAISPLDGINAIAKPYSSSVGKQRVVSLESKMDNVPLIGWMARKLAANKLREDASETDQMFEKKIQDSAESKMAQEVNTYVERIRYNSYTNLFQPLLAMDLEPEALQMATTSNQIVMRYRLAGRDQMAANTARPRDDGRSLLSFQLHQSAINNAIARVGLNGEKFTMDELKAHLAEVMGLPVTPNEEAEEYAEIGFAKLSPVQIDFVDERFNITLNLSSLKVGEKGKPLKNITMKASYIPMTDGMRIKLVQDKEGTRRSGRKRLTLAQRGLISSVMIKIFKEEYTFNSLPKKMSERIGGASLEISQLVVADGWLGVSIDDPKPVFRAAEQQRFGIRRIFNRR